MTVDLMPWVAIPGIGAPAETADEPIICEDVAPPICPPLAAVAGLGVATGVTYLEL